MLQLPTYSIEKCIHSGSGVEVYAGVRSADGCEVVLKAYAGDDANDAGSRARRELEVLRAAAGPGIPRVIELVASVQPPVLVTERVTGQSLDSVVASAPLASDSFLEIAIQLADALSRIHDAGFLHCNVTPASVRVDSRTYRAHLVDFGMARVLGAVERTKDGLGLRHGVEALAYIAPEQTGRMARGIDPRSDLYALGATLYFALTGRPPFESDDPLALVHAHMARMPVPPVERRPEVPATLSRIAIKLLQKEPSDRYQTAHALVRDLHECRDQLQRTGRIANDFPLGTADVPVRPLFSTRLFGRDAEIRELRAAYQRITNDAIELVILTGPPGAGKSALIQELRSALAETEGYLAQGKFDLYRREVPYAGLVAALESLTNQILSESEARVTRWRTTLREALGNLAAVVIELVPDLEILLPDAPPVPKLGPRETQARLVYALQRLVLGCGRPEHPLVLFIDDLQWADPGSRSVLEALLAQSRGASLLVVTTCRNENEPAWRPVAALATELKRRGVCVNQIEVTPLGTEAAAEMLAHALDRPIDEVRPLAERVAAKTGSNPLWIQHFITHVHELGLIRYVHPAGWQWDDEEIAAADIPEGAVGLLVAKLERLAIKPRAVIQFASCVGDEFEVELLCELTGEPRDALEPPLFELAKEGLIAPSPRGFRFVHDRIREAAQALLSEDERSRLHHRTGRHLLEHVPLAALTDRVFEIADHLNRALEHLSEDERRKALEIDVAAGARALTAGASQTAAAYLTVGRQLLVERDWEGDLELPFRLLHLSAEAAHQTNAIELALSLLDALDARPLSRLQQATVAAKRIQCLLVVDPGEAFARTLAELRRFGIRIPSGASYMRARWVIEKTIWRLRGSLSPEAFGRRPAKDPSWLAPILIAGAGGAAIVRQGGFALLCITTSRSLLSMRQHGALPGTALTLAAFAAMVAAVQLRTRGIDRYVDAAFEWMEKLPSPIDVRTRFSLHCFTLPYLQPRRTLLEPLRTIAEAALEVGDPEYAIYTAGHRAITLAICGEPLADVIETFEQLRESAQVEPAKQIFHALASLYALFTDPAAHDRDWSSAPPAVATELETQLDGDGSVAVHWFMLLCYFGRFEQAAQMLPRFGMRSFSTNPTSGIDFRLFRAVCRAGLADGKGRFARRRVARSLRIDVWLTQGRVNSKADFEHVLLGLQAESAQLCDRTARALKLYQRAAKSAFDRGYRHRAALMHERRAQLLRRVRRDMEATAALQQAVELYKQWGATGKVRQLEWMLRK